MESLDLGFWEVYLVVDSWVVFVYFIGWVFFPRTGFVSGGLERGGVFCYGW